MEDSPLSEFVDRELDAFLGQTELQLELGLPHRFLLFVAHLAQCGMELQ